MYLVDSSSIKEFLYDDIQTDRYGVIKPGTKRDCLDVGNEYSYLPFPYTCFDKKIKNTSQLISSQQASLRVNRSI